MVLDAITPKILILQHTPLTYPPYNSVLRIHFACHSTTRPCSSAGRRHRLWARIRSCGYPASTRSRAGTVFASVWAGTGLMRKPFCWRVYLYVYASTDFTDTDFQIETGYRYRLLNQGLKLYIYNLVSTSKTEKRADNSFEILMDDNICSGHPINGHPNRSDSHHRNSHLSPQTPTRRVLSCQTRTRSFLLRMGR